MKKQPKQPDRLKLLHRFWLIAHRIGEENAYNVVESLYKHRSLRVLSNAELSNVVNNLVKTSGFTFETKNARPHAPIEKAEGSKPTPRKFFVIPNNFFSELDITPDISTALKKKIQVMVFESKVSLNLLKKLVVKMSNHGYFGISQAQKVIEALKNIKDTGWKETGEPVRHRTDQSKEKQKTSVKLPPSIPYYAHPEIIVESEGTKYVIDAFWRADRAGNA